MCMGTIDIRLSLGIVMYGDSSATAMAGIQIIGLWLGVNNKT